MTLADHNDPYADQRMSPDQIAGMDFDSMEFISVDKIGADYELKPSQIFQVMLEMCESRQASFFWGKPGLGKSQIARQVAKTLNATYIDVRALQLDPVDLRGIPRYDPETGQTKWAPAEFLPLMGSKERFLINLEELSAAPQMVQAAMYELVLDRTAGNYVLPEGASIIACGNRESDRGVFHQMPKPLANRFIHFDIKADVFDWQQWAAENGILPEIIFFMEYHEEMLHQFDPESDELAFPTPRMWEFVSDQLKKFPDRDPEIERAVLRGAVGEQAAVALMSFLRMYRVLPHPSYVLMEPEHCQIPSNQSALLALCAALYNKADEFTIDPIVTFALRLERPEVAEFLIQTCAKRCPEIANTDAYLKYIYKRRSF